MAQLGTDKVSDIELARQQQPAQVELDRVIFQSLKPKQQMISNMRI